MLKCPRVFKGVYGSQKNIERKYIAHPQKNNPQYSGIDNCDTHKQIFQHVKPKLCVGKVYL